MMIPQEDNVGHPFSVSGISSVVRGPPRSASPMTRARDSLRIRRTRRTTSIRDGPERADSRDCRRRHCYGARLRRVDRRRQHSVHDTRFRHGWTRPGRRCVLSTDEFRWWRFTGQDSGLNTTVGNHDIFLFTDSTNPNIVWGVRQQQLPDRREGVQRYVDTDGHLVGRQFAAIAQCRWLDACRP